MSKTLMGVGIILSHLNVKKNSATTLLLKQCVKTVQKHVAIAKVSLECKQYIEFNIAKISSFGAFISTCNG